MMIIIDIFVKSHLTREISAWVLNTIELKFRLVLNYRCPFVKLRDPLRGSEVPGAHHWSSISASLRTFIYDRFACE